jgi:hypothetical protein
MKLKFINTVKLSVGAIAFFALTNILPGCNKFLDENDPSNLTPDSYYTIPEHAEASIASGYASTRFIGGGAGIFSVNWSMLEMVTGTAGTETGQNTDLNNLLGLAYNGDNVHVRNWWNGLYSVIAQVNLTLAKVPGINPMDAARKKQILGEAAFLRAWSYFYLVRIFGDVPLLTKPVLTANSPDMFPGRTSTEDVYKQIVADLIEAEASGLPWRDVTGRTSLGAVKSLLAEVYLTMAGFPLNKGAAYYTLAANKANEVITNGSFSLFAKYGDLHSVAQDNKGENIFQIQYLVGVSENPLQGILLPNFKDISKYGTEIGSTVPALQFYNSFEAGDKRKEDTVGFFYTSYYSEGFKLPKKNLGAPYIYKHFDSLAHGVIGKEGTGQSSLNLNQIRYAQVLLSYAEAQNEAGGGPNTAAWTALKDIRTRAGLTTPAIGTFSQATFREAILRERWHELCYENITWFDMVRLRKAYNSTTNGFDNFVGYTLPPSGAKLASKHLLFPLPTEEMRNNPNLKPQNPDYQ